MCICAYLQVLAAAAQLHGSRLGAVVVAGKRRSRVSSSMRPGLRCRRPCNKHTPQPVRSLPPALHSSGIRPPTALNRSRSSICEACACTGSQKPSACRLQSSSFTFCAGLPLSVGAAVQPLINRQAEAEAEWRTRQFQQLNGGVEGVLHIGDLRHVDDLLQHQGAERLWYRSRLLLRELACCAPTSNSQAAVWRTSALAT